MSYFVSRYTGTKKRDTVVQVCPPDVIAYIILHYRFQWAQLQTLTVITLTSQYYYNTPDTNIDGGKVFTQSYIFQTRLEIIIENLLLPAILTIIKQVLLSLMV